MYKCVMKLAHDYKDYADIMPFDEKNYQILELCKDKEYFPRSYRPDILLCEDGGFKTCELSSRFCYSGYLLSSFSLYSAILMCEKYGIDDQPDRYSPIFDGLMEILGDNKRVAVPKSDDRPEALKLYKPFFEKLGIEVEIIPFETLHDNMDKLENCLVINEINQKDLHSMDIEDIKKLVESDYVQDLRSALLPHDKRFLALLFDDRFTGDILSAEETSFLREHTVKTYVYNKSPEIWEDARHNKDGYILKHARLGKSERVYAGCTVTEEKWQEIFDTESLEDMILQPFEKQRRFKTHWEGKDYLEYAVGTILLFDDKYFGPGIVRGSTFEVTNQGDDRKYVQIITDEGNKIEGAYYL